MNIILAPEGIRKGRLIHFHHRHLVVLVLVGLVYLPVFLGFTGFKIYGLISQHRGLGDAELLAQQKQEIRTLKSQLLVTRDRTEVHLNALAQRMGRMQAELFRLNALGGRLTQMAKLDPQEFDFSQEPAMGGPERPKQTQNTGSLDLIANLERLAEALDQKAEHLNALESVLLGQQVVAAAMPAGWPTQGGWVSSHFGMRADPFTGYQAFHEGVDMAARLGTEIKAVGDGVISHAGLKSGYGQMVEITHGQGYATRYAHTSQILVKVGDRITKGQPVALVGSSGRSTGPHLHFEVRRNGRAMDPEKYLVKSEK